MCNKKNCNKITNCSDKKMCNRCKVYLKFENFKMKRDETYQAICIECNQKMLQWRTKNKCEHGRQKSACKECKGGSVCEHDRLRTTCKECKGGAICKHNLHRADCRECKSLNFCEHNKRKNLCRECNFSGWLGKIVSGKFSKIMTSGRTKSREEYLGCDIKSYKIHLEGQFHPGMSWDNYGEWEIDHITAVNYENPTLEQQIARLHYANTQPLWKDENMRKGNKLIYGVIYNHDFHAEFKDCLNN
jgi:hypothetical protein